MKAIHALWVVSMCGGFAAMPALAVDCSGGAVTESGGYRIHAFTSSGTLTVNPGGGGNVEVLVVAGGGGGGSSIGAGGGAGGLLYNGAYAVSPGSVTVTVGLGGNGGAAGGASVGIKGNDSVFDVLRAYGGGGGGGNGGGLVPTGGGSGGGSSSQDGQAFGGSATSGQGSAGGDGLNATSNFGGGGGGGAGSPGTNGTSSAQGGGGNGLEFPQFAGVGGSPAGWFAGGGAGGSYNGGTHGLGGKGGGGAGGATGSNSAGGPGVDGTGGGGGSGNYLSGYLAGGKGGDGIVLVRYLLPVAEGTLSIDVTPDTASWTITAYPITYAGPFSGAGDLATNAAPAGSYTVQFHVLDGYISPPPQTLAVTEGAETTFNGDYAPVTYGTLSIHVTPDAASWSILSHPPEYMTPVSGSGDLTPTQAVVGSYTVRYEPLAGYVAPADQTRAVTPGTNAAFDGIYGPAGVRYVDAAASGAGDGTSWANAFTNLAGALALAVSGDAIWVAGGTNAGPFTLTPGVAVYGGFASGMFQTASFSTIKRSATTAGRSTRRNRP